ncbi:hemolysin family protein [Agrococcus versicolor]|uniref:Hemolysin family protein n=1 Tax=Agrococcus versicolor TaxID=501482 RepID=A0ABP5MPW8_9MICO
MLELALFAIAAVLVVVGAWLAACDAALGVTSTRDLQEMAQEGRRRGSLQSIALDLTGHVMVVQFGRILFETTAAVLLTIGLTRLLDWWWALVVAVAIMAVTSFILVGTSPRAVGRAHSRTLLRASASPIRALRVLFGPLATLVVTVGDRVTPGRQRETAFTSEEQLLSMVDEATTRSVLEEDDRELIHSIFDFNQTFVREVMVPRTDMVVVDADLTAEEALRRFLESGLSRMPVAGDSLDEIEGILYLRDVVRSRTMRPDEHETARSLARVALFVPESKKADDTLAHMQLQRVHVAMVVDEYGGIAGLVTLEDLIEELIGDIHDEHDRAGSEAVALGDGTYVISPRLQIDELGDLFELHLDDDDVDSVGGLLQKALGRIAEVGDVVEIDGLRLAVERIDGRGREAGRVRVERLAPAEVEAE